MARWDPDAENRLHEAAFELFAERGYEEVTVAEIAARAGLTRRSFFRYFPDKREVVFSGSAHLPEAVEERLDALPEKASPRDHLFQILTAAGEFLLRDPAAQRARQALITSSAELQERERTKLADLAAAIARPLERRGLSASDATLLGAVGSEVFRAAYARALASDDPTGPFGVHLESALDAIASFAVEARPQPIGSSVISRTGSTNGG